MNPERSIFNPFPGIVIKPGLSMPYFAIVDKKTPMLPVRAIQRLRALSLISDCFGNKVNVHNGLTN